MVHENNKAGMREMANHRSARAATRLVVTCSRGPTSVQYRIWEVQLTSETIGFDRSSPKIDDWSWARDARWSPGGPGGHGFLGSRSRGLDQGCGGARVSRWGDDRTVHVQPGLEVVGIG